MAIRTVVTRGFGNGTFNGTIPLVVTRGYIVGAVPVSTAPASRTVSIYSENRTMDIEFEDRTMDIEEGD